jgi:hypothetical protein
MKVGDQRLSRPTVHRPLITDYCSLLLMPLPSLIAIDGPVASGKSVVGHIILAY